MHLSHAGDKLMSSTEVQTERAWSVYSRKANQAVFRTWKESFRVSRKRHSHEISFVDQSKLLP